MNSERNHKDYPSFKVNTDYITSVLDKIIDRDLDDFSNGVFKVRTKYSNSKFYLNRVEGSYDESLYLLIHYIMFKDGIYKDLLTDEQYKDCKYCGEEIPDIIWNVDYGDHGFDTLNPYLDEIYFHCIEHVYKRLTDEGLKVKHDFKQVLDLSI